MKELLTFIVTSTKAPWTFIFLVVFMLITLASVVAGCVDESDCGYLGVCDAGQCSCDPGWHGPQCSSLRLAPVPRGSGFHRLPNASTWGGSVVRGNDGRLYMYASEMVGHCGIDSWDRNSRIVLASADNVTAPFVFEKELWAVFSHEPAAIRAPSGEYVVFFTTTAYGCGPQFGPCTPRAFCPARNLSGCNPGGAICPQGCSAGVTSPSCTGIWRNHEQSALIRWPTYMAYAVDPRGPYSTPVMVYNGSDRDTGAVGGGTGDTNMAAVIDASGALRGLWRGRRWPDGGDYQYAVTASDWRDPATYVWGSATRESNVFASLARPSDLKNCGIEVLREGVGEEEGEVEGAR